jgi:pimeloyl-ACP methyl ester carboxylesterase
MQTRSKTTRGRGARLGWAFGLTLVAAGLVAANLIAGCSGMKKSAIEARLLELPKNAGLAALGLNKRTATVRIEGGEHELEYVWAHVPASADKRRSDAPIVFVHGTPACLFNWSLLCFDGAAPSELVGAADLYAFDVVGHGLGTRNAAPYSFQGCADSVRGFLELLDLRNVTLVGQSYGGEFAWRAALDAPERIAKLVLLDSSGYARGDGEWLPEEVKLRNWPGAGFGYLLNSRDRMRPALQHHFAAPLRDDQLEEMFLLCENADNWKAMTQLCRDENGARAAEIAKLTQPTLLLWGERDVAYTVEKVAKRFQRDIAQSKLVLAPAGHYPHEEAAPFVRRALLDFHLAR